MRNREQNFITANVTVHHSVVTLHLYTYESVRIFSLGIAIRNSYIHESWPKILQHRKVETALWGKSLTHIRAPTRPYARFFLMSDETKSLIDPMVFVGNIRSMRFEIIGCPISLNEIEDKSSSQSCNTSTNPIYKTYLISYRIHLGVTLDRGDLVYKPPLRHYRTIKNIQYSTNVPDKFIMCKHKSLVKCNQKDMNDK